VLPGFELKLIAALDGSKRPPAGDRSLFGPRSRAEAATHRRVRPRKANAQNTLTVLGSSTASTATMSRTAIQGADVSNTVSNCPEIADG
jgi:hypothetical protein